MTISVPAPPAAADGERPALQPAQAPKRSIHIRLTPRGQLVAAVCLAALTCGLAIAPLQGAGWLAVRIPLGLLSMLLLPGLALLTVLMPSRRDLDGLERLALALGLSLAVNATLALLLDRTELGFRPVPIALGLLTTVIVLSVLGWLRLGLLPPEEYATLELAVGASTWSEATPGARFTTVLVGAAVALSVLSVSLLLAAAEPPLTEFYVLDQYGFVHDQPRQVAPGEPVRLVLGVSNREHAPVTYRADVRLGASILMDVPPFELQDGQILETPLVLSLPAAGEDPQVDIFLYREPEPTPYRRLRLILDVRSS